MTEVLTVYGDWIGYAGSGCVIAAFCMRQMLSLRLMAILGNVIFIAYALSVGAMPVLFMNLLLLPLNMLRLVQSRHAKKSKVSQGHEQVVSRPGRAVIRVREDRYCCAPLV